MLYVSMFDAKDDISRDDINKEREQWLKDDKDKAFQNKCKSIKRYEVVGLSPLRIFFIIETDDPTALNMLSSHFGNTWNSITYPVVQREIVEALEEDRAVIGG